MKFSVIGCSHVGIFLVSRWLPRVLDISNIDNTKHKFVNDYDFFKYEIYQVPWNSMELLIFPQKVSWSSMEFHGIPWKLINFILKKIIFLNIVFGIWLMIRCYLAKTSQKRYILHWFQYRNSYFEHPSVSENGTRSAKMACCFSSIIS